MHEFISSALKIANKMTDDQKVEFIFENFSEFLESLNGQELIDFITDIFFWLNKEVNISDAKCRAIGQRLFDLIANNWESLKRVNNDTLALFMCEAMRCVTLGTHSSTNLEDLVNKVREVGIPITGNPENCIRDASIKDLTVEGGTIVMEPHG